MKVLRVASVPIALLGYRHHFEKMASLRISLTIGTSFDDNISLIKDFKNISVERIDIARKINIFKDVLSFFKICFVLAKLRPKILHSQTPKASILCALAGFLMGIPIRIHTFTGQRWITLKKGKRFLLKWIDFIVIQLNTVCLADSPSQADFLNQTFHPFKKVLCLGKGSLAGVNVRDDNCKKEEYNNKSKDLIFLFVGRVTEDKGIFELLKAFSTLEKEIGSIQLWIVGHNEMKLNPIKDSDRVHFFGFDPNPQKFYRKANLLVLPSYREGFGTVVLEAAAEGQIPTIGSDIIGLKDAIVDGQTGWLCKSQDVDDLILKMRYAYDHQEEVISFGKAAYLRAKKDFNSNDITQNLVSFYKKVGE